jgi:hypothetical protein
MTKTRKYAWSYSTWVNDYWQGDEDFPPAPTTDWWDGKEWYPETNPAEGRWTRHGWFDSRREGTWNDEPGVVITAARMGGVFGGDVDAYFPIRYGGSGGKGHYEFRTSIRDKSTRTVVRQLTWGLLIDYKSRKNGVHYFYL